MQSLQIPSPLEELDLDPILAYSRKIWVKRDDLIHSEISGNKWRKLKYNLEQAEALGFNKVLSFGGAYSNHIAAMGAVAPLTKLELHAMIRGEELNEASNDTLRKAAEQGLKLHFIERSRYRKLKRVKEGREAGESWKDYFIIPEGGANEFGVRGCEEIYSECPPDFDFILLSAGTGTTAAGWLRALNKERLIVISALKGGQFLREDILSFVANKASKADQLELLTDYHFGGYAKLEDEVRQKIESVSASLKLPLDYLYTGKAFLALLDLLKQGYFPVNSRILFYHSGGLQGNRSFG